MNSVTVADLISALRTYPQEAEIYLDSPYGEGATMHIHVEYDCIRMWDGGDSSPAPFRPVIVHEESGK